MNTIERCLRATIALAGNGIFYYGSAALSGYAFTLPETYIDHLIQFQDGAIGVYISFFILIFVAFLRAPIEQVYYLTWSIPLASCIASCIFLLYPTKVLMLPMTSHGAWGFTLTALHLLDTPKNCLPSLHAAISVICANALIDRHPLLRFQWLLMVTWVGLICWSAIAIRQHVLLDITAGLVLGVLVLAIPRRVIIFVRYFSRFFGKSRLPLTFAVRRKQS